MQCQADLFVEFFLMIIKDMVGTQGDLFVCLWLIVETAIETIETHV